MLAKKKKLGKKQIKEDKLVTFYSKSLQLYENYKNQIFIGAAVVVVIIAAIVYYGNISKEDNIKASAALAQTLPLFEAGNYQAAIDGNPNNNVPGLLKIVDQYGGTEQGEVAKIYLGHAYYYQGNFDEALKYYSDFSGSNNLYEAAALAGEASCYEAKGEHKKAAELYRDAANTYKNNVSNPKYLLSAGVNFIESQRYDDAENVLKKIKDDYETAPEAQEADKFLARIKIKS